MRVYHGHTAAVRDVCWNNDGSKFVSCSFDRYLRLWDTFTGECLKVYTTRRVPYCVRFYPKDDKFFVVGQSDNKAVTFDSETGVVTQEYNHHLAAVNSVTFVEGGRKMVTTSDDKKMLVWEWDIGVPVKTIAEPDMHSMPAVTVHPKVGQMACQSLDNAIKVYASEGRFQENRKKKFTGHQVAGFACEMTFSPSGKVRWRACTGWRLREERSNDASEQNPPLRLASLATPHFTSRSSLRSSLSLLLTHSCCFLVAVPRVWGRQRQALLLGLEHGQVLRALQRAPEGADDGLPVEPGGPEPGRDVRVGREREVLVEHGREEKVKQGGFWFTNM